MSIRPHSISSEGVTHPPAAEGESSCEGASRHEEDRHESENSVLESGLVEGMRLSEPCHVRPFDLYVCFLYIVKSVVSH